MNLLEQAIRESGDDAMEEDLGVVRDARRQARFEDKVQVAAKALPKQLMIGGTNPLKLLFKLLSDGIHARTDEESIEIVDTIDRVLSFLIAELNEHRSERVKYASDIKQLQSAIGKRTRVSGK